MILPKKTHKSPRSLKTGTLKGLRFGAIKAFLGDSIYKQYQYHHQVGQCG
jgi:hypothetical protein